jgi:CPA2 family monovalent cation:H+ antiporter-2
MDHSSIPYVREILVFLASAGILVPVFQRFHISPVLGFLIAGFLLGPHGMGHLANIWAPAGNFVITSNDGIHALAEMGIVFLLFMIGLELSFERLTTMRRFVFGLGGAQVGLTALAIGAIAYGFGNAPEASIVLGLGFALSSTAIVMQLLTEQRRMGSTVGRKSFSILLFQDLTVVLILFILDYIGPDLAQGLSASLLVYFGKALASAAIAITGIVIVGRLALRPLFHLTGKSHNRELFMAATLLAVISIAAGAEMLGLSMALGAFLAGLLLAETEYRHDVEITIEPFKGLLLGLFFMSVGMGVDLQSVLDNPFWIPASVVGLFAIKAAILYPIARAFKLSRGRALELGLLLGQGGEFVFVVLALATSMNMIPTATAQFMLIVTSLSMMATPLVAKLGYYLREKLDGPDTSAFGPDAGMADALDNHVILAGYGRMGRLLSAVLLRQHIPGIAIDSSGEIPKGSHMPILYGHAEDPAVLAKAGIRRAIAVAVLIDHPDEAKKVVAAVKALRPHMPIVARARDAAHAADLYRLGATVTIPDVIEGSLHVAQELLTHIGLPEDAARHIIDQQRTLEAHVIESAKAS